jgi:cytoskeletal protein CcmA (bactofilin family)
MFSGKSKKETLNDSPATANSSIGAGTTITGDVNTTGDLRIDGTLNGNIAGRGRVLIGPEGVVNGDMECQNADILGRVEGRLKIKDLLHLRGKGFIKGDIHAGRLQVEPTASFNGQCFTGGTENAENPLLLAAVN